MSVFLNLKFSMQIWFEDNKSFQHKFSSLFTYKKMSFFLLKSVFLNLKQPVHLICIYQPALRNKFLKVLSERGKKFADGSI